MRAVVQRVSQAQVRVKDEVVGCIGLGLLVLLGVGDEDGEEDARYLADKVTHLRIFADESGKMNRSVLESEGEALVVSQFTLYGDARKGRRPSFSHAAQGERAQALCELFAEELKRKGLSVSCGEFAAHMLVALENDGPVTILLDSKRLF